MTEMQQQIAYWFANGDVGRSSKTMASVIGFDIIPIKNSQPWDIGDFARCVELLNTAPEARQHLKKMTRLGGCWIELVERWAELEAIYYSNDEKKGHKIYDILHEIHIHATKNEG